MFGFLTNKLMMRLLICISYPIAYCSWVNQIKNTYVLDLIELDR